MAKAPLVEADNLGGCLETSCNPLDENACGDGCVCGGCQPFRCLGHDDEALTCSHQATPSTSSLAKQCLDIDYCCPDAKHCLTPSTQSCLKDIACPSGMTCCPLTKLCVTVGKACTSPCSSSSDYCCPDALKCLSLTNPGVLCMADSSCGDGDICCPLTKLCVKAGATCTPP